MAFYLAVIFVHSAVLTQHLLGAQGSLLGTQKCMLPAMGLKKTGTAKEEKGRGSVLGDEEYFPNRPEGQGQP